MIYLITTINILYVVSVPAWFVVIGWLIVATSRIGVG